MEFWSSLLATLESGQSAFVAIVATNTQNSPGTAGARLFVPGIGEPVGTIGGGGMELELISQARAAMQAPFAPRIRTLVHRKQPEHGDASGLICAGEQTHVEFVLTPSDLAVVSDIVDLLANDKPGVFRVTPTQKSVEMASPVPGTPPVRLRLNGHFTFEMQLLNWKRIAIVGGGHCGLALSQVMSQLGYVVTVYDTRPNCRTFSDNMYARYLKQVDDYTDVGAQIPYAALTHVVVMTTDFPSDVRALTGLVGRPFPYVGLMGSSAKIRKIFKTLTEAGVDAGWLDTLIAPIGLPMQSDTPQEIAVSIAAQILQLRPTLFEHAAWPLPKP